MLSPVQRFENKYIPVTESGCWLWTGATGKVGYGIFNKGRKDFVAAHRYSYELHKGSIGEGLTIDHLCRVRCCVNPDHLEAVSLRENIIRGESPSAHHARQTHCLNGHEFTFNNTYRFRGKARICRQCRNHRQNLRRRSDK